LAKFASRFLFSLAFLTKCVAFLPEAFGEKYARRKKLDESYPNLVE